MPRYDDFQPEGSTGVYASEAVLAEIACQACETTFLVLIETAASDLRLANQIREETLHYGDPPNAGCCGRGGSMQSEMIRVVEYWLRHDKKFITDGQIVSSQYFQWARDASLEGPFSDPWGDGDPAPPRGERWTPNTQAAPRKGSWISPDNLLKRLIRGFPKVP